MQVFVNGLFELNQDPLRFKQNLRDFLIQLREVGGDVDNAEFFVDEREAEAKVKLEAEHAKAAAVPGMLKPSEMMGGDEELVRAVVSPALARARLKPCTVRSGSSERPFCRLAPAWPPGQRATCTSRLAMRHFRSSIPPPASGHDSWTTSDQGAQLHPRLARATGP